MGYRMSEVMWNKCLKKKKKRTTTSTTNTQDKANREYCSSDKHRKRGREIVEEKKW